MVCGAGRTRGGAELAAGRPDSQVSARLSSFLSQALHSLVKCMTSVFACYHSCKGVKLMHGGRLLQILHCLKITYAVGIPCKLIVVRVCIAAEARIRVRPPV